MVWTRTFAALPLIICHIVSSEEEFCLHSNADGACSDPSEAYFNVAMNAYNVFEVENLNRDVINKIFKDYQEDVQPHLATDKSTDDFCTVSPYNPETTTWGAIVDASDAKSDIKWYSVNNRVTYDKYLAHVEKLGILDIVESNGMGWKMHYAQKPTVYSMFFIPRSFSTGHEFHVDWSEEVGMQVVTFLIPLKDNFQIGLAYVDEDDHIQTYDYQLGKAIGVGGGFLHSTGIGGHPDSDKEEDVLLCVYVGSDHPDIWEYALNNIQDELEHYFHPRGTFMRNENLIGRKSKCQ
ncbi:hypothetical protein ACHAWF_018372 [Thalassiosira exigua]